MTDLAADDGVSVGVSSATSSSPLSASGSSPLNSFFTDLSHSALLNSAALIRAGAINPSAVSPQAHEQPSSSRQSSGGPERVARTCVVCGDSAFGHHYGCIVCNGCKGFFRRSIWSRRRYACRFGNDCSVSKTTRNVCRACRLQKAFDVGMKPEAVQLERDRYGGASTSAALPPQWANSMRDGTKNFTDSSVQTSISAEDFKSDEPIRPTPCRLDSAQLAAFPISSLDVEQAMLNELIQVEKEIWNLRDTETVICELKPFGELNVKFDVAFASPELVSRRYPLDFSGKEMLNAIKFIDGWRRGFTWFVDWARALKPFGRLPYADQICLAKRRLINVSWWAHAFHSYLSGRDGIALSNGHYHPHTTDSRANEADPVMKIFSDPMMPMVLEDLLLPFRQLKIDFNEFVLMKALILFRDEFFLSEGALKIVREVREQYSRILYQYVLRKCGNDVLEAVSRFTEILNFMGPILHLTARVNERVQMSVFFNIIDFDPLQEDVHSVPTFYGF
ncbi:Nuclear hormone receptor family member nhr-4 [Aphelenchoides fujianensis]|nr:Nuclear hormone receptor family member nhr-4 [Aphelenchoides fujianensis]